MAAPSKSIDKIEFTKTSFCFLQFYLLSERNFCWFLFPQISDDDRMSLTTAVSEDDDGESVHNSPYKVTWSTID